MVDQPKLDQMLTSLRGYRQSLERLSRIPEADFLADPDKVASAKYNFVVAIECCIDIANHIIASEGHRFPTSNADSFAVLGEKNVLAAEDVPTFMQMSSFRNRLVHMYWDVDDLLVREFLQNNLTDFDRFAQAVAQTFS